MDHPTMPSISICIIFLINDRLMKLRIMMSRSQMNVAFSFIFGGKKIGNNKNMGSQ